jgi:flavin reductase (DIM6/NTAB) family NADH-FMN oxidoreductase RutF
VQDPPVDRQKFRHACGRFTTGITVTTVLGVDLMPHGITMNSFTSVSADPPMVLVCVDHRSRVLEHFRNSMHFGVNVLSEHQRDLSHRFSRNMPDRFESVGWYPGKTGVPLLHEVLATFECRMETRWHISGVLTGRSAATPLTMRPRISPLPLIFWFNRPGTKRPEALLARRSHRRAGEVRSRSGHCSYGGLRCGDRGPQIHGG